MRFKIQKWLNMPFCHSLFIFILFFIVMSAQAAPSCKKYLKFTKTGDLTLKIKVPKNSAYNSFETVITFLYSNFPSNNDQTPKVSLQSKKQALEQIASGKAFNYRITFPNRNTEPKIGRVLVADRVWCENIKDISNAAYSKDVRRTFKIERAPIPSLSVRSLLPKSNSFKISSFSDPKCGDTQSLNGFILGGERNLEQRWPWVAALFVKSQYACTSNFISRSRAVTAAHCFEKGVTADQINLYIFSKRYVRVKNFIKHPKFRKIPDYDIAVVETESIHEKSFVPICLTGDVESLQGSTGSILSWSPIENEKVKNLLGTEVVVVSNENCKDVYDQKTPRDSFCVQQTTNSASLCRGDSGSGFMIRSNKRWFLRGVVSTGLTESKESCASDSTVIFTDVTRFLSFVVGNNQGTAGFG